MAVDEQADKKAKKAVEHGSIARRVGAARRRLRRGAGRDRLRTGLPRLALVVGVIGALRPWLWPLPETMALIQGSLRTLAVMAAALMAGALALVLLGRRRGPSALGAARSIDRAIDQPEVVASGYAFEHEGRDDGAARLARERALEALAGTRPEALFALPPALPPWRKGLAMAGALALGLALGSYHPALRGALLAPPSAEELEAAGLLKAAAEGLAKQGEGEGRPKVLPGKDPDPSSGEARLRRAAELARQAAQAAQRGDRSAAIGKLASMRAEGEQARQRARALASLVRSMKENLPSAASGDSPSPKSASSLSEGLGLLARSMRQAGAQSAPTAEEKRALERLERGAQEATKGAASGPDSKAFAEALERARQALLDGDREGAAKALEEAARAAAALEARSGREGSMAGQVAALLQAAEMLEGKLGAGPGPGETGSGEPNAGLLLPGGSGDKAASLRARLAALGLGRPGAGGPGPGGGHVTPPPVEGRKGLEPTGSVRARSAVGEGERAVKALAGLGRGARRAPAYKEVFPSYDAAVEEGLSDERIPAARRTAVRRYFESIRPGDGAEQGDEEHPAAGAAGSEGE
ncbi:MAG: hypothetical protein MUF34_27700 [Polyangiaceae bacterium]|jgi:hypothetical protein|nr:hypothetical protein [Polyangiaceae bacterium]